MNKKASIFLLIIIILFFVYISINYFIYIPINANKDFKDFVIDSNNVKVEVIIRKIDTQTGDFIYTTVDTIDDSDIKKRFLELVGNVKIRKFEALATLGANYYIKLTNNITNKNFILDINPTSVFINGSEYSTNLNLYALLRDNIFHKDYFKY